MSKQRATDTDDYPEAISASQALRLDRPEQPLTAAGQDFHDELHAPGGAYEQVTGRPECGTLGCGSLSSILAIEAEMRARSIEAEAIAQGWLKDPLWPHFGPGIGPGPHDPGRVAARAAAQQVLALLQEDVR